MKRSKIFAIILAGGQSSRLFPFNKVLSDLTGSGKSLIQQAYSRLGILPKEQIYILTVREMVAPIRRQLKFPANHFFVDPVRRGTWPAILWAMSHLRRADPNAVMAIVTGDHVIRGDLAFRQAFRQAAGLAQEKPAVVMLGILPHADPQEWRGFGCFRTDSAGRVIEFEEKPAIDRAREMIQETERRQGGWRWNSGMFFFRIATAEAALKRLQPEMFRVYEAMAASLAAGKISEASFLYEDFADKIPHPLNPGMYVDNSIDYAIMTPLVQRSTAGLFAGAVTDTRFRWTDLGQWGALRQVLKADRRGNICVGKAAPGGEVRDSILIAERGRQILAEGVQNMIVAFAHRTALVLTTEHLPRVKEAAQEALRHPDRFVMEHEVKDCDIQASGGRVIAIGLAGLSVRLRGRRLVVSAKHGFIP